MKEKQALRMKEKQKEDRQRTQAQEMVDVEEVTFEVDPLEQA
jgi:hypothetical protein